MNAPNQLNFLPEDYLVRKAQHRTNVICATLFVVMITAIATAFTIAERAMRGAERRHAAVDQQYTEAAKRIQQMQQMRQKQSVLARQAELSGSLIDRVPRSYMLAEVTNLLPGGVYLTDLDMEMRKRSVAPAPKTAFEKKAPKAKGAEKAVKLPPPPDPYDTVVRISGVAETDAQVAGVITSVKESKIFRDVNLLISTQMDRTENNLRRFNVEMTLNASADLSAATADLKHALTQVQQ